MSCIMFLKLQLQRQLNEGGGRIEVPAWLLPLDQVLSNYRKLEIDADPKRNWLQKLANSMAFF